MAVDRVPAGVADAADEPAAVDAGVGIEHRSSAARSSRSPARPRPRSPAGRAASAHRPRDSGSCGHPWRLPLALIALRQRVRAIVSGGRAVCKPRCRPRPMRAKRLRASGAACALIAITSAGAPLASRAAVATVTHRSPVLCCSPSIAVIAARPLQGRLPRPRRDGAAADVAVRAAAAGGRDHPADRAGAGRADDLDLSARLERLEPEDHAAQHGGRHRASPGCSRPRSRPRISGSRSGSSPRCSCCGTGSATRFERLAPQPSVVDRRRCSASIGGFTTMLANAGGPAWQMHLLPQRLDKLTYVGTLHASCSRPAT